LSLLFYSQPPKKDGSQAAEKKAQQVKELLEKIEALISSRDDLTDTAEGGELTSIYPTLPTGSDLDDSLQHVLNETSFLQYRGAIMEDLCKKSLYFLLQSQGLAARTEITQSTCELLEGTIASHMLLDRTASDCIHLLPPSHAGLATVVGGKAHNNSLYGILNQCKTPVGSRLLQIWLRQPLVELTPLQLRQNAVSTLVYDSIGRDRLRDEGLAGLVDFDKLASKLGSNSEGLQGSASAALANMYKLYLVASQQMPRLKGALDDLVKDDDEGLLKDAKQGLEKVVNELAKAEGLVEAVLDLDAAPREYLVQATFNEDLQEIKDELDSVEGDLADCHSEMNDRWFEVTGEQGQIRLEMTGENEWRFRVPNTNAVKTLQSDLRDEVEVHKILKNGAYFSTKMLRQVARKKMDLLASYDNCQKDVVNDACKIAATYAPVIERVSSLVAELDVLASLAHVAAYSPNGYCKPVLTDGEDDGLGIFLKAARHPCVELQENVEFIPNDISLVYGESSFCLVTGPNMGGKSTYIRSVGAIVAMAQIGSFVPCSSAKINLVHHILARVGAGDAQNRGISTFMAEMLEASSILSKATKRSLIIIDELGRGTSTYDGYGLASAISEYLIQRIGCCTVFATHFHELTALEQTEKSVKNCHVTAESGDHGLTFLYEVRPGPCLQSFGIQVAEMAHVPQSVIQDAKRRAKELENFEYRNKRKSVESHAQQMIRKFRRLPMSTLTSSEEKKELLQNWLKEYKATVQ
jgi:DNA mismatch repair protein MSH2